ncbi:MAG: CoA transferase, partial [Armatimonadetes bacterium]|nr:CoA transferase [Armatimonadota bacterium]
MARVLDGIRVLDLGRYLAGPIAGAFLADMGAEVIRVEKPGGEIDRELGPFAPNGESFPYGLINHRNKKAITLDLDVEAGRQVFRDLVKRSDVVMDNFALDAKTAKGLTYDSLKQVNPAIIYVSVTGFGLTGPYVHRSSFDPGAQ